MLQSAFNTILNAVHLEFVRDVYVFFGHVVQKKMELTEVSIFGEIVFRKREDWLGERKSQRKILTSVNSAQARTNTVMNLRGQHRTEFTRGIDKPVRRGILTDEALQIAHGSYCAAAPPQRSNGHVPYPIVRVAGKEAPAAFANPA